MLIVYGEKRMYSLTFVSNRHDDEVLAEKFLKFLRIRLGKHAQCQLLAVGTTACRKDFYY